MARFLLSSTPFGKKKKTGEPNCFTCPLCMEEKPIATRYILTTCTHDAQCKKCLQNWIETREKAGNNRPSCPFCRVDLAEEDTLAVLGRPFRVQPDLTEDEDAGEGLHSPELRQAFARQDEIFRQYRQELANINAMHHQELANIDATHQQEIQRFHEASREAQRQREDALLESQRQREEWSWHREEWSRQSQRQREEWSRQREERLRGDEALLAQRQARREVRLQEIAQRRARREARLQEIADSIAVIRDTSLNEASTMRRSAEETSAMAIPPLVFNQSIAINETETIPAEKELLPWSRMRMGFFLVLVWLVSFWAATNYMPALFYELGARLGRVSQPGILGGDEL